MKTTTDRRGVLGAAAGMLIYSAPMLAQESGAGPAVLEEVVVTAQKRVERVQDVPISITVADQSQLERQQVNSVSDLSRVAPSLEIQQAPGQSVGGGGQIRGIGTQSFQQGAVGSVGIVVDQVSQGNANIADLFDVSRIEVLKGPQGTLFGLTTSAGVINITTNPPEFGHFSARLRTELADEGRAGSGYGQQVVQGLVNVPLAETAALRVSANANLRQGVNRNTLDDDLDAHRTVNARARFLWEPSDAFTVNLIGDYSKVSDSGTDFFVLTKANPQLVAELAQCGITASAGNRDYCSTSSLYNESETIGGSAQIDYDAGPFGLTSITAYRSQDIGPNFLDIFRLDVNPLKVLQGPTTGDGDLFTQEFRIASPNSSTLEYTAGVFYSKQKTHNDPAPFNITLTLPFPPFPTMQIVNLRGNDVQIDDESYAAFGQATLHVGEHLRLIGGGRYTNEKLSVAFQSLDGPVSGKPGDSIDNFSWKAGAQYEFNRDLMSYATISRGYKGPQVALGDLSNPANRPNVIRPEIPTSYELGVKGSFLEGGLLTDLNVFYLDLKDYQGQLCTPNINGGLQCNPQNISKVVSKGVEVNVFGRPSPHLTLNAGLIYDIAEYPAGFTAQDGSPLEGEQLASAPKVKGTFSGEFSQPFSGSFEGFIAADAVYKSDLRLAAYTDPNVIYPNHWIFGGRLGVRDTDGRWTAALFARNLNNNHEPVIAFKDFPDGSIGSYGALLTPQSFRLVGLSFDVRF